MKQQFHKSCVLQWLLSYEIHTLGGSRTTRCSEGGFPDQQEQCTYWFCGISVAAVPLYDG